MAQLLNLLKERVEVKIALGVLVGMSVLAGCWHFRSRRIKKVGLLDCVGNTPLIYLHKLSQAANCNIYVKMECLNPFGSSKDRAVKQFLNSKECIDNQEVIEASSGSTAISLVQMAHILNKKVTLFLPNDLAQDKYLLLQTLKANIIKVPPVSIVDSSHFCKLALKHSKEGGGYFTNQFQNIQNAKIHQETTGPQIYRQTNGLVDSFVCGGGTGGTLAGVSAYLKRNNSKIKVILADPEGSGLFNKVNYGVMFTSQEKEGHRLKNPFDTVVQGVGLNRITANLALAQIDEAYKVNDSEVLHMLHYLIQNEGLFVGGSTGMNLAAAVKEGRRKPGSNIVTVAHDSGIRYLKKLYSQDYLKTKHIDFIRQKQYPKHDLSFIK